MSEENKTSIDHAVIRCEQLITRYRINSIILLVIIFILFLIFLLVVKYQIEHPALTNNILVENRDGLIKQLKLIDTISQSNLPKFNPLTSIDMASTQPPDKFILYSFYVFCVVLISILTSFYKSHLNEIAKNEQMLIGFLRIRIAGNNYEDGFATKVRRALTDNAFTFVTKDSKNKIENPIPGHPGTELVSKILNKILDGIEIKPKG